MELTPKEAWSRLLTAARRDLPDATVKTWLEPAQALALADNRLVVAAPDQFAVEWNASKHADLLARLARGLVRRRRRTSWGSERSGACAPSCGGG